MLHVVGPSPVSPRRALAILLLAGIALRVGLWLAYEPVAYPDTPSYMRLAAEIRSGDFSNYDGRRPPGYAAVLALAGDSSHAAWALQMVAGLVISILMFVIGVSLTGRPAWGLAFGMAYNLNLAQLFFEATLLAETIGTLFITAVVAGLLRARHGMHEGRGVSWLLVGVGVLAGAAIMTKPQFIFLPALGGVLVAIAGRWHWRRAVRHAALIAVPGVVMVLAWSSFNYARVGYFALSTQAGIGLMNQSLAFVELAPDRYRTVRDIYVKYRDAKVARSGLHTANWDAVPELLATTGLSLPELSRELTSLSVHLFVNHPIRYGIGVTRAWIDFWMVPNYWRPERLSPPWLAAPLALVWRVEHVVLRALNAAFLVLCGLALVSGRVRGRANFDWRLASIAAVVLATSVVQALAEYGENARYAVSVQPLVVVAVAVAVRAWVERSASPVAPRRPMIGRHSHMEVPR